MPPALTSIPINTPIAVTLQPGVKVVIPAGSPGVNAVNAANTTGPTATSANITITADGVTINNNNNPTGNNQTGLRIQSSGNATIKATNSTINLSGTASDWGLYAIVLDGGAPHNASVNLIRGTVVTSSGTEVGRHTGGQPRQWQRHRRGFGGYHSHAERWCRDGTTQYGLLAHAERCEGPAMRP